jgi:hypothetical protein
MHAGKQFLPLAKRSFGVLQAASEQHDERYVHHD